MAMKYQAVDKAIMLGSECVGRARSKTFAKRAARALNMRGENMPKLYDFSIVCTLVRGVIRGRRITVVTAKSELFAIEIAAALNSYKPNGKGK